MALKDMLGRASEEAANAATEQAPPEERQYHAKSTRLEAPYRPGRPDTQLSQRFTQLTNQGIKYVILSGYEGLPFDLTGKNTDRPDEPILLLFEPPTRGIAGRRQTQDELHLVEGKDRELVAILGLEKSPSGLDATYRMKLGGKERDITLIPKGCGFLPDTFERRILNARQAYNDVISISDVECTALALIHYKVHRTNWLADEPGFRKILADYVDRRVGNVGTCEIKQFGITLPSKLS